MLAGSIIKDFNIFEAGSLHFSMGSVTQTMVSLVLETVKPASGRRRNQAIVNASVTLSVVMRGLSDPPTTARLNRSSTIAKYSQRYEFIAGVLKRLRYRRLRCREFNSCMFRAHRAGPFEILRVNSLLSQTIKAGYGDEGTNRKTLLFKAIAA